MKTNRKMLISALVGIAGGFVAGLVYQSEPGRRWRIEVGRSARARTVWLEGQLHSLENQLNRVEDQLQQFGEDLGDRVRDTLRQYVPDLKVEREWEVKGREVEQDLPRMPRS